MRCPTKSYKGLPAAGFLVLLVLGLAGQAFADNKPRFAYVANEDFNNISAYTVDGATGALTPVPGSPFAAAGNTPTAVAVDPSGKFVYLASKCLSATSCLNGTVSAYTINSATGALVPVPGSPFAAGTFPKSVAVDPSGRFAYVVNECSMSVPQCVGIGSVSAYTIDGTTGALTPVPGSPFAAGSLAFSVAVDPSGKFAYVANPYACLNLGSATCAANGNISAYAIDSATGALSPVPGSPFAAGGTSLSVAVARAGKFVYAANDSGYTISAYSIDSATGALIPVPGSPFAANVDPDSVVVDPSGKFAYVANYCGIGECSNGTVSAFTIDSITGALTPVSGSPYTAGRVPNTAVVDPSGKFVYVVNECANALCDTGSVSAYAIDNASGALTPVPGSPFLAGVRSMSLAITGQSSEPFETFQAKVEIDEDRKTSFRVGGFFKLGATSNGIDPVSETVELQVGPFSAIIPAGSFRKEWKHTFNFEGRINGVDLRIIIDQVRWDNHEDWKDRGRKRGHAEGNNYLFTAEGRGDFPAKFVNPVTVGLTIGDEEGSTTVKADIDQ